MDKVMYVFLVLISCVMLFGFLASANAEEFVNSLPSEVVVTQGDYIRVTNLSNSTLSISSDSGLFNSGVLYTNGTWTGNMPYDVGYYPWSDSNGNKGVIRIIDKIQPTVEPVINVSDNVVSGTATPETPIAVTVINPNMDSSTVIVKTDSEGNFEQKLNPAVEGDHNIYVTDKNRTTYTSYEVDDINRNLETRLSVLKVLESILKIIYGSE